MKLGIVDWDRALGLRLSIFNNSSLFKFVYNNGYLYNKQYKIFNIFIVTIFFFCFLIKKNKK